MSIHLKIFIMKKFSRIQGTLYLTGFLFASVIALSFSKPDTGGEGFQVLLNDELVFQHFGPAGKHISFIDLQKANATDNISVKYYHCGTIAKNSVLTIRNDKKDILKKWLFSMADSKITQANCAAGEIFKLDKEKTGLNLYFSSADVPEGRLLAGIKIPTVKKAF
jgi:hypothetical protein